MGKKESVEYAKFTYLIKKYPKLKKMLDNFGENTQSELNEMVKDVIQKELHDAFIRGIIGGWYAYAARAKQKVKDLNTKEEILAFFEQEEKEAKDRLNLNIENQKGDNE